MSFAGHSSVSSSVKNETRPYVIFYSDTGCDKFPDWVYQKESLKVVSLDVGIVNLSIRIEIRSPDGIIPLFFQRIDLKKLCENTTNTTGTCNVGPDVLTQANNLIFFLLGENSDKVNYLHDVDLIGIERQLPDNIKATKVFQHFISTFLLLIRMNLIHKHVVLFDIYPTLKYSQLGCPSGLDKRAKKKWGISKAKEILTERQDHWSLEVIRNNQGKAETKADDLSDTVILMEAIFIYLSR